MKYTKCPTCGGPARFHGLSVRAVNSFEEREAELKRLKDSHEALLETMRKAVSDIKSGLDALGVAFKPSVGIPLINAQTILEDAIAQAEGK